MVHAVGDRVHGYEVLEVVTRGASATTLRARSLDPEATAPEAIVALKVFNSPDAAAEEQHRLRSVSGVEAIAPMVDSGDSWLATRWINGRPLSHLLSVEAPLDPDRANRIIADLANVVDDLHSCGVVHGDLSPSNVLIGADDAVTVIDLGRTPQGTAQGDPTTRVEIQSTPRYAAPEVAHGLAPGPEADRYALALIGYEALTATSPFPEVAHPIAMLGHQTGTAPAAVSENAPQLGTRYDPVFEQALAKDPDQRHTSARDFVQALLAPPSASPTRNNRGLMALAAVVAAVALAVGGVALARGGTEPDTSVEVAVRAEVTPVNSSTEATTSPPDPTATTLPDPTAAPSPSPASEATEPTIALAEPNPIVEGGWPAGRAAATACNLLDMPGFEQGELPYNWYQGDPDMAVALVPSAGLDGTTALRIGANNAYGLQAEQVPVIGGDLYVFSAWVRRQGEPAETELTVRFADADFEELPIEEGGPLPPVPEGGDAEGFRFTQTIQAPVEAAWALPTFFKNSSAGSMLVDEVVFGPLDRCGDVAS